MSLLSTQAAHREYANRPADERFPSVAALVLAAQLQRDHSAEREYNVKDLIVASTPEKELVLQSPKGSAKFTHWAFGQFARMLGAPAQYLREIPPSLAADCLNFGIHESPVGTRVNLLAQAPNGTPVPTIRAATSDSYARVWDSELYSAVQNQICANDPQWVLPPTWSGESAGAYRGDRDSFLILVNGGSIVTDPSLRSGSGTFTNPAMRAPGGSTGPQDGMYRGLLIRNSEVGASSITIESILYRYICGNHLLWGAVMDRQYRRRHVGTRVVKEVAREISSFAYNFTRQSAERDNAIIRHLISTELAHTKEAVIDELRKMGATKDAAEAAYATCEKVESASPRSYWGLAQGLTRNSQEAQYQNERFDLDQLASKILSRGAKRVAA